MLINHIENHLKQTNPSKQNENRSIFLQKQNTINKHVSDRTSCHFLQVTLPLHPKSSTKHRQLEQDTVRRPGSISRYSEFLKISFLKRQAISSNANKKHSQRKRPKLGDRLMHLFSGNPQKKLTAKYCNHLQPLKTWHFGSLFFLLCRDGC